jgi:polysaccharide biosynthesis protein PslH
MRILILTPTLPYPMHQGGAIRNYGLLHGLYEASHEVVLLSFHSGGVDPSTTPLVECCTEIITVPPPERTTAIRVRDLLLTRQPDLARRLASPEFRARLETLLASQCFDLVQFEGLEMAIYVSTVRRLQPRAKLCYDAHNAEYALQNNIAQIERERSGRWAAAVYSSIQAHRIARFERDICQSVDCVVAVSEEDAAALRLFRSGARIYVVPNGIFADSYTIDQQRLALGDNVLVFTGKMDYRPNVDAMLWFTDEVLPLIRQQMEDVRLYIVGQKPHPTLEALREQPNIEITGWVADVQPFLQAADVYIAPLRMGSGTRLKILEAMAAGCAIVATPTAAAGLDSEVRESLLLREDAANFASAVIKLLNDPDHRAALGSAAQAFAHRRYDWSALIPCLLSAYKEIGLG